MLLYELAAFQNATLLQHSFKDFFTDNRVLELLYLTDLSNFWSFPNIIALAKLSSHKEEHLDLPKSFDFTAHEVAS